MAGHHDQPMRREKQVKGCPHNAVYRVSIKPKSGTRHDFKPVVQWICPPRSLSHAIDSAAEFSDAARAALSFAADEGHPVEQYAATTDSGWHVGLTPGRAWSNARRAAARSPKKRKSSRSPGSVYSMRPKVRALVQWEKDVIRHALAKQKQAKHSMKYRFGEYWRGEKVNFLGKPWLVYDATQKGGTVDLALVNLSITKILSHVPESRVTRHGR
jgi:hypothetical protein